MSRLTPGMNAVTYIRVSDQKQGRSGLGLEAQQAAVRSFVQGYQLQVVREYREVETGTNKRRRPELKAALDLAREHNAVLLIAKLDRLARNVHFISGLMESRVPFVAVDMPDVDDLTIHILAAVAEKEAKLISQRTRDALSAAKVRGVRLGTPQNFSAEGRGRGAATNHRNAVEAYRLVSGYVQVLHQQGMSLRAIARRLTQEGHRTVRGKPWRADAVAGVLKRTGESW